MSSRELSEWLAYWRLEPPPDPYGHTALIASVVASTMGTKSYKPSEFDPRPDLSEMDDDDVSSRNLAMMTALMARRGQGE